jgi:hypothetical protein
MDNTYKHLNKFGLANKIYVVSFVTKEVHIQVVENIKTQVKEVIE